MAGCRSPEYSAQKRAIELDHNIGDPTIKYWTETNGKNNKRLIKSCQGSEGCPGNN